MDTSSFLLVPIDHRAAAALRERGGPVYVADEFPGYPCRQCLEDAKIGEELILVSHDLFSGDSAYQTHWSTQQQRQRGPFQHPISVLKRGNERHGRNHQCRM